MDARLEKTIELDCPPGGIRPGDLIEGVIAGLGLELKETESRFFGNWTWRYDEVSDERWREIQPTLRDRIKDLYMSGVIRYGSW
jgi:hypothetical protein